MSGSIKEQRGERTAIGADKLGLTYTEPTRVARRDQQLLGLSEHTRVSGHRTETAKGDSGFAEKTDTVTT